MEQEIYEIKVEGIVPLLQHRFSTISEEEPKANKRGAGKYVPLEEAERALYKDEKGVYEPAEHLEACFVKEAANYKIPGQGKKTFKDAFKAGIIVEPRHIPIIPGKWIVDNQAVVINRARIMRSRPRFDKWSLVFKIQVTDERITEAILKEVVGNAGKFVGVGDYRPKYGRFQVVSFKLIK